MAGIIGPIGGGKNLNPSDAVNVFNTAVKNAPNGVGKKSVQAVSKSAGGPLASAAKAEKISQILSDRLDINQKTNDGSPFWSSGARSLIKVGGQPLAVCQDFRWTISYQATPIQTIDTAFPWDIDVGQVNIQATLSRIMDPIRGPEADGVFSIMSAAIHQPMVEMQVLDAYGTCMFFARGMFTSINGNVTLGQLGNIQAGFVGVAYQHYVSQQFEPYGVSNLIGDALGDAQDLIKDLSGGFL